MGKILIFDLFSTEVDYLVSRRLFMNIRNVVGTTLTCSLRRLLASFPFKLASEKLVFHSG